MEISNYHIQEDIKIWALEAKNFPEGIPETFNKLEKIVGGFEGKVVYGLSRCNGSKVEYWAAVNGETEGNLPKGELEPMIIAKGDYLSATLENWQDNIPKIAQLFDDMNREPGVKPQAWCIEWYKGPHMLALVETI